MLLCLFMIASCTSEPPPPVQTQAQPQDATSTPIPTAPAVARPVYTVQRGTVEDVFVFSGRWLSRDQSVLSFEIAGTARRVEVRRNDTVTAGQLLADLQITDLENQLASAQLELETALANLASGSEGSVLSVADAEIALANANLRLQSAKANSPWTDTQSAAQGLDTAERDLENAQRNYDDAISRADQPASVVNSAYEQLQSARDRVLSAQNSYYAAAQRFNNYQYTIAEAENALIQAQMNLDNARSGQGVDPSRQQAVQSAQLRIQQITEEIQRSSLYSPIDGEVLEVNIQPGSQVQAFAAVITVGRPNPKEIIASLAFNDAQRLSVGQVGTCEVFNQPDTAVQCVVRQVPLSTRDADQTTRVAASLELLTGELPTGQTIEVRMPLETRENVLWLPPAAIRTFQNRKFVVLQTPDGPRTVDVQIGLQTNDRVEILSGVEEGDVVEAP